MSKTIRTIFWAGLVAGVLDIIGACTMLGLRGVGADRVLQGIASGLIGPQSFKGGAGTVVLGGALHFLIAFSAAAIYYLGSRRIPFLTRRPIAAGLLYGVVVYAVMNGVVLPLSAFMPKPTVSVAGLVTGVITLSCLVGLPISLIVWRFSQSAANAPVRAHSSATAQAHS